MKRRITAKPYGLYVLLFYLFVPNKICKAFKITHYGGSVSKKLQAQLISFAWHLHHIEITVLSRCAYQWGNRID